MFRIYRLEEKSRLLAALKANGSILLCGEEGIGKTVVLNAISQDLIAEGYQIAVIATPATSRQMLISKLARRQVVR